MLITFHEEVLGGATISVLRLVPGLERAGWRPYFWVPRPSSLASELERRGLRVLGAPRPIAYSLSALRLPPGPRTRIAALPRYLRAYARALRSIRPALVHANSLTSLAEATIARSLGVPVLMHVHEMLGSSRKSRLAVRAVHAVGSEVVAVSGPCGAALELPGRRTRVVHECVPLPASPSSGSPGEELVVGSVGVISQRKGSDLFVGAAARLRDRPGVRFELIGAPTDPLDAEWADRVLAEAGDAGVHHELRADVQAKLDGWDLFALPSRRDPFPIALLEAMAAGLPVVGARRDGIEEMLEGGAGVLCEPEDPDSLAAAIAGLIDSAEQRAQLGRAARERVESRYTLAHQLEGVLAAYEAAAGPGA